MQVKSSSFLCGKVVYVIEVSYIFCVFKNILNEISLVSEIYVWRFIEAFVLTLEICFAYSTEILKSVQFLMTNYLIWYVWGQIFWMCPIFVKSILANLPYFLFGLYDKCLYIYYGNTGCGVFKRGVQN